MLENQNTNMHIIENSLSYNYQFLMFQAMISIQTPSLKSQQANGTIILAWIALEPSFQY